MANAVGRAVCKPQGHAVVANAVGWAVWQTTRACWVRSVCACACVRKLQLQCACVCASSVCVYARCVWVCESQGRAAMSRKHFGVSLVNTWHRSAPNNPWSDAAVRSTSTHTCTHTHRQALIRWCSPLVHSHCDAGVCSSRHHRPLQLTDAPNKGCLQLGTCGCCCSRFFGLCKEAGCLPAAQSSAQQHHGAWKSRWQLCASGEPTLGSLDNKEHLKHQANGKCTRRSTTIMRKDRLVQIMTQQGHEHSIHCSTNYKNQLHDMTYDMINNISTL